LRVKGKKASEMSTYIGRQQVRFDLMERNRVSFDLLSLGDEPALAKILQQYRTSRPSWKA
jgi:hypothetical protein